jgi:hypothetical protein
MKNAILIAALVVASPAQACHRFHVWHYPVPQRCDVAGPSDSAHIWFVEITKTPPLPATTEEDMRAAAVEKLKQQLK